MGDLDLTISDKKLVAPNTKVVYLGILIDTENGTVSIPPDKLHQISDTVRQWLTKQAVLRDNCNPYWVCCCMFIRAVNEYSSLDRRVDLC